MHFETTIHGVFAYEHGNMLNATIGMLSFQFVSKLDTVLRIMKPLLGSFLHFPRRAGVCVDSKIHSTRCQGPGGKGGAAVCESCRALQRNLGKRSADFRPGLESKVHSLNKLGALAAHYRRKHDELIVKQFDSLGASMQAAVAKQGDKITESMPWRSFTKFVKAAVNGIVHSLS